MLVSRNLTRPAKGLHSIGFFYISNVIPAGFPYTYFFAFPEKLELPE
jgi:hypothetical protein